MFINILIYLAIPDPRDGDQSFEDIWGGDVGKF